MTAALRSPAARAAPSAAARRIGRAAIVALYQELALAPKPGLVSFVDAGSHADMDASTFLRSLFALRRYCTEIAALGERHAPFVDLERLGLAAERRMLAATGGVNTHRGAVFMLGLLCAAAGAAAEGRLGAVDPEAVRRQLRSRWGDALQQRRRPSPIGLRDAGTEAALGYPIVFDCALPALRRARAAGLDDRRARLQAFFAALAELDDTNLVRRGGLAGLVYARRAAAGFLFAGGAARPEALVQAGSLHQAFVARRLSPGGSADVLAATLMLDRLSRSP